MDSVERECEKWAAKEERARKRRRALEPQIEALKGAERTLLRLKRSVQKKDISVEEASLEAEEVIEESDNGGFSAPFKLIHAC